MGLLNLVYREQLFPRPAYQGAFEALLAGDSEKDACRAMVGASFRQRRCLVHRFLFGICCLWLECRGDGRSRHRLRDPHFGNA